MTEVLGAVHSIFRWVVLALGVLGGVSVLGGRDTAWSNRLRIAFVASLDLEWLLGAILLATYGSAITEHGRPVHATIMTVAVVLAHALGRYGRDADTPPRLRLYGFVAPLLIVAAGHVVLS